MPNYQIYRTLPAPSVKRQAAKSDGSRLKKIAFLGVSSLLLTATLSAGLSVRTNQHAAAEAAFRRRQKAIFAEQVSGLLLAHPMIKMSVATADVGSSQIKSFGQKSALDAASTAKVLTAVDYLKNVESGRLSLSQTIGDKTARQQLMLMLKQSDDTAWQLLNQKIGHGELEKYGRSIGLGSYQVDNNTISSADLTKLLGKLAGGELLASADTNLLLSYMQQTNYEDFITPAVPVGFSIYHKVGIDDDHINDAAIIASPGGKAFVISIMTDGHGLYDWQDRANLMQQIAAAAIRAYLQ
jgi:beta-lactamase class A